MSSPPSLLGDISYISRRVIELIFPNIKGKGYFEQTLIKIGASMAIPKTIGEKAYGTISDGADNDTRIIFDFTPYQLATLTPFKRQLELKLDNHELRSFTPNVIEDGIRSLSREFVNIINKDIEFSFNGTNMKGKPEDGTYGYFITKRPISIDTFSDVRFDKSYVVVSARYAILFFPDGGKGKFIEGSDA